MKGVDARQLREWKSCFREEERELEDGEGGRRIEQEGEINSQVISSQFLSSPLIRLDGCFG